MQVGGNEVIIVKKSDYEECTGTHPIKYVHHGYFHNLCFSTKCKNTYKQT